MDHGGGGGGGGTGGYHVRSTVFTFSVHCSSGTDINSNNGIFSACLYGHDKISLHTTFCISLCAFDYNF